MADSRKVLIVDVEPNSIREFSEILSEDGYEVYESSDVEKVIDMIPRNDISAIITESTMHRGDGTHLFQYVTENHPEIPVILLTAQGKDDHASPEMIQSAFCYLRKPPDYLCLKRMLDRAVEQRLLKKELRYLRESLLFENMHYRIIGNTIEMLRILEIIEAIRDSDSNVLISGETGAGKELIARAITNGAKNGGPFVVFNCAAIPKELVESELFGWEQREFSGLYAERIGKIEEASRGTLFLNEIGHLELSMQSKLLRVFQEKYLQRLGSSRRIKTDFRLISSTKYDLRSEVQNGNFREDLFHRISQVEIKVPPLRERKEDIPLLVSTFMNEFCSRDNKSLTVPDRTMKIFKDYDWPGNVRQLRNIVERAVMLASADKITQKELPDELFVQKKLMTNGNLLKTLRELEMEALKDALQACKGNKSKASRMLGISRKAMYKRLRECRP